MILALVQTLTSELVRSLDSRHVLVACR